MEAPESSAVSDEVRDGSAGLGFDLNEPIPSPEDSVDVVRFYHDNPSPPPEGPAGVPSGVGSVCAACGKPEVRGHVVVCDGCERGFHLACAGMRGRQAVGLDEWVCGECMCGGVRSKRWPLGVKLKMILDINASPPSDGEADVAEGVLELRRHPAGGNSFGGNPFGAQVTSSNFSNSRNGFGMHNGSGMLTQAVKYEDILHHTENASGGFDEVGLGFSVERLRSSSNTGVRVSNDVVLQALKDFVSERHGVLDDGWRVEFKHSIDSNEPYIIYCAANGRTFDSLSEVAHYLGLTSGNSVGSEVRRERSLSMTEKTYQPRKRKSKASYANGVIENKESLESGYFKKLSSHGPCPNVMAHGLVNNEVTEAGSNKIGCIRSQQNSEGFPVQFEDFFVLSLGKVDTRTSYHDSNSIWPVGYKSCWHDRITGSLFICEVLDGGDSGPVFKIRRCSCSTLPIPSGSIILSNPDLGDLCTQTEQENHGNDESIDMILSEPIPPMENDVFSCLSGCSDEANCIQTATQLYFENHSVCGEPVPCSSIDLADGDKIGEISLESSSSSSACRSMSREFANACSKVYDQRDKIKLLCKHVENGGAPHDGVTINDDSQLNHTSLEKFCSLPSSIRIPSISQADAESGACDEISKWLAHDRFGLDVEFVQELLEQLPGAESCSNYLFLRDRSNNSTMLTVGSGRLVVNMGSLLHGKEEEVLDYLYRRSKKSRLAGDHMNVLPPPLGRALCSRIPPPLVGDLYQVWEILRRFHAILGLKEAFSLRQLEEELINPWFSGSCIQEKSGCELQDSEALKACKADLRSDLVLSSSSKLSSAVSGNNPPALIHIETKATKEAAEAKLTSVTYNRCSSIALTKAHASLLRVLIGELQSKVAALVDPNFDSGEFKSKRRRKKDIDCFIPLKKLRLLPINELTWPELARRYILAVLPMDGNLDSSEVTVRESSKVFRCLQGDGGVLCGSLTGVAGMEADAHLLAEAAKKIFASLNKESHVFTIEEESDGMVSVETNLGGDDNLPVWAQLLEPVRKLPTNVGTRIRKCVYEALEKDPPEWAKKILEHSISKEVYKGNASGPTKKAVISVLADVSTEAKKMKSEKRSKRNINVSISDVIMKLCRIMFRRAAAADDKKVFCNLLGRKLMNPSDNDDEGLLGSPAMVSQPLDFRTIDLRLAAGSYGGSHEAFHEDVEQPNLVELVETLSQKFEILYEEVVFLDDKFVEYSKLESISSESKKEIDDLVASTSVLPKAPWDEGLCKVCGIDKDDDSVLLCDTCDAEYHTYWLIPPLARIPKGNWYCPSCVFGKNMVQDASLHPQIITRCHGRNQGEVTRVYLESLTRLASNLEDSEYWEVHVDERTFLLKFLCDELLNLVVTHQHIDNCSETSIELQQKLRSLSLEWKNLKSREAFLVARAAKVDVSLRVDCMKEGSSASVKNQENCVGQEQALSGRSNYVNLGSDDMSGSECARGSDKLESVSNVEHSSQHSASAEINENDACPSANNTKAGDFIPNTQCEKIDTELTSSNSLPCEANGPTREIGGPALQQVDTEKVISPIQPPEGLCVPSEVTCNTAAQCMPPMINESHSYNMELKSVRSDLSLMSDSITAVESELAKVSIRREFLGVDSWGGLYWASAMPDEASRVIVDRSMAEGKNVAGKRSIFQNFSASFEPNKAVASRQWSSYETDAEIDELIGWLKHQDPKEKELRESVLHWQKSKFLKYQQTRSRIQDDLVGASSVASNGETAATSNHLATRVAMFLEKLYGPFSELETVNISNKQGKRARLTTDEKMFRCGCLELVWKRRHHCSSCHRTYMTDSELKGHNNGRCTSGAVGDELKISKVSRSLGCPYDLEGICSNFETKDSNKDLIQEIGLIGSNGIPSLVPSSNPYLSDSAVAFIAPQQDVCELGNVEPLSSVENTRPDTAAYNSHSGSANGVEVPKANFRCPQQRNIKFSHSIIGAGHYHSVPKSSMRPLVGKVTEILKHLKINLLDMEAALPVEALRPSKADLERRWAWRGFVKSASTIYEMVQATIVLEDMMKTEYLRNEWWYWYSYSAAAQTSTISSLSLRIYSLDAAILYEQMLPDLDITDDLDPTRVLDQNMPPVVDSTEKLKIGRKVNKKRKEPEG